MSDKKGEVYLDFAGAMQILKGRGQEVSVKKTIGQIGYTEDGYHKMQKKTPKAVEMVFRYLKENDLKFEDLVKER